MDWEDIFRALCQPKAYASCLNPSEFGNLTIPQLYALLSNPSKPKNNVDYSKVEQSVLDWRQNNVSEDKYAKLFLERYKRLPTVEDKREYYGVWPLGNASG